MNRVFEEQPGRGHKDKALHRTPDFLSNGITLVRNLGTDKPINSPTIPESTKPMNNPQTKSATQESTEEDEDIVSDEELFRAADFEDPEWYTAAVGTDFTALDEDDLGDMIDYDM
ncbi:hypothetical protein BOTBODRAFT_177428 [Botryobasidium botryosum FD-172 SS1]|uniref:Uncharacterized protein n=1 Tax=Botryobasidium botryosum (strain FD-172 SS1) TaxID=930990 RepID=A0A067M9N8_BOTB1|nr:hypothetical protein BOTBODRAFT_177428 [Botryobasidium botryosum FD-172 SS1]